VTFLHEIVPVFHTVCVCVCVCLSPSSLQVLGGELFDRVVELQHYNEEIGRDLVATFLGTLDFLHSNGIVHRDLKVRPWQHPEMAVFVFVMWSCL
jgi:hypothetical protein